MTTLTPAVKAGIISEEAAFCGLSRGDLERMNTAGFGYLDVVVRFRSSLEDACGRFQVRDVVDYDRLTIDGRSWSCRYIRDVMAAAL